MPKPSSQEIVKIEEINEDVLVLKDGSIRAVLMVSGINFDLMSEKEQESLAARFQDFLNSLDFTLQIVVHSRNMNIEGYLAGIEERKAKEKDPLLRFQTENYIAFIKSFSER